MGDSGSSCIRVATRRLGLNRIEGLSAQLVTGREDVFYRWEFDAAAEQLPDDLINCYVRRVSNPDSLRGSFGGYRALTRSSGTGHLVAEEAPDEMLVTLTSFWAPYRDGDRPPQSAGYLGSRLILWQ